MNRRDPIFASRETNLTRAGLSALAAPLALLLVTGVSSPTLAHAGGPLPSAGLATPGPLPLTAVVKAVAKTNKISGLTVEELGDGTTVLHVKGSSKPTFNVYRLGDPDRLVVDLAGATRGDVPHVALDSWACGRVSVDAVAERNADLVRVVVELKREVSYVVVPKKGELVVTITPREVAPEAYFSHKNATERRRELAAKERKVHNAEQAIKVMDAEARKRVTEARSQAAAAKSQAAEAKSQAAAAKAQTEAARSAERKALAAEKRALLAEKAASSAAKAKARSLKNRRELRAAKAERETAEALRVQAQADRKRAENLQATANAKLAKALGEVNAEKQQLAAARGRAEKAEMRAAKAEREALTLRGDAASAKARAVAAERAAKTAQSEAETSLASARGELARAKAAASRAEAAAKSKLAKAERADAAAAAASADSLAAANLKAAAVTASAELARARADVKAANARSEAKLAAAGRAEREATETLAAARAMAKVEAAKLVAAAASDRKAAKRTRAQAESDAVALARKARREAESEAAKLLADAGAKRESAAKMQAKAKTALSRAESAVADAERERKAASSVRKKADAELKLAKKQARTASAADKARLAQELQKARAAQILAESRQAESEASVRRLRSDRNELKSKLAEQHKLSGALDRKIASRKTELSRLEKKLAQVQKDKAAARQDKAAAREVKAASREVTVAKAELAELRASLAAERSELSAVTQDVEKARATLDGSLAEQEALRAQAAAELKKAPAAAPAPESKVATVIKDVRFEHDAHEQRVIVATHGPMRFHGSTLTPTIKMLTFDDAEIAKKLERSLDASSYGGSIKSITSFSEGDGSKVLVSTASPIKARLEERPGELVWHFPVSKHAAKKPATTEVVSMAGSKVAGYGPGPKPPLAAVPTQMSAFAPPTGARTLGSGQDNAQPVQRRRTRWRGERIDIELQDAPIKDVLLLFSDIGHVNIIAGRGVEGTVTMKLNAVPWDQALDIIFRSLALGSSREGNVIRVATVDDLESERRAAIERANARIQLKPLVTRLVPVSYATVDEMIPKVASVLSPRGTVTPDERTNTLIINDVEDNIALAEQLVSSLDTQTPQVLIEARIVEARTNFTRNLGIQWGFDFTASPGTGNPTGLLFPNSVGVGGGGTGSPVDSRGLLLPGAAANPNYAVDLPAPVGTGQGGAIGFAFGSISGNLNTNLRLSAAESTGEVRIISAPKIVTLDNNEAQIETGVQIPISQVSAQGVNTRFVNATLSLQVTPHVTNEGAVLLDVEVQKNEADFINTGARGDPTILTNQARSRLLVNDADTAVIGGIYARNKAVNFTKIPWLGDIPIVGWFFKNKSEADTRSEILIFLTPKIVNRASSIGG